jgi:hypothetical protein
METIHEYIRRNDLTLSVRHKGRVVDADKWEHDAWAVTLRGPNGKLATTFRMGTGHNGKLPECAEVLDSLASDANAYDNARDFADFAAEFGYDTDSRKAEAVYKACGRIAKRLRDLLGEDEYAALTTGEVERL